MIFHFPTVLLLIGYAAYWLELYVWRLPGGRTTPLAACAAIAWCSVWVWRYRIQCRQWALQLMTEYRAMSRREQTLLIALMLAVLPILLIALYASLLPPHLMPEFDALNYHYTLPRQHLVTHSFAHLPWSVVDLVLLPVQSALAPYWFATSLPNKVPQLFFMISLWALTFRITRRLSAQSSWWPAILSTTAVLGSHGFAIQYGTAMLDLALCYLVLACLDSLLSGRWRLVGVELALFIWSKFPILYLPVLFGIVFVALWARRGGWTLGWAFHSTELPKRNDLRKMFQAFAIASLIVALPFMAKSMYYAGTPLFPLKTGWVVPLSESYRDRLPVLKERAVRFVEGARQGKDDRSWKGFFTHFVLLAVPSEGVNNAFDYPLGLPYLLFLVPFAWFYWTSVRRRHLAVLPTLAVIFWAVWWVSSHQARFLYAPLTLIFITCAVEPMMVRSRGLWAGIGLSLALTTLSVFRGNRDDFGKKPWDVLRPADQAMILRGRDYDGSGTPVPWPRKEVAYATFPVLVTESNMFVLPLTQE